MLLAHSGLVFCRRRRRFLSLSRQRLAINCHCVILPLALTESNWRGRVPLQPTDHSQGINWSLFSSYSDRIAWRPTSPFHRPGRPVSPRRDSTIFARQHSSGVAENQDTKSRQSSSISPGNRCFNWSCHPQIFGKQAVGLGEAPFGTRISAWPCLLSIQLSIQLRIIIALQHVEWECAKRHPQVRSRPTASMLQPSARLCLRRLSSLERRQLFTRTGLLTIATCRKLVIIGDGACGKTSLLSVFTLGYFPTVCFLSPGLGSAPA